jgi:hypothetical protein
MKSLHTKLVLSAIGIALLATPAFAQRQHRQVTQEQTQAYQASAGDVQFDNHVVGADPDAQIRSELSRDSGNSVGAY